MPKSFSSAEIIRRLLADGWIEARQVGSHKQFVHPEKPGRVTVAHPYKDVPTGTRKSIERQTGIRFK